MRNWEEICGDTQGKASGIGTGVQDVKNWQFRKITNNVPQLIIYI